MNHHFNLLVHSVLLVVPLSVGNSCKQQAGSGKLPETMFPSIKGDFEHIPELSDEFNGEALDSTKWFPTNPTWEGRQPAFFSPGNVVQGNGVLELFMRKEEPPEKLRGKGFHNLSTAAVRSRHTMKYGYFEVRSRAMKSKGSSGFWFYDQAPDIWTEIDVFEICGTGERANQYNSAIHIFYTPLISEHRAKGSVWKAPYNFADDFHIFGLEWTPYIIRWYVDGAAVRTEENTHWHQPLTMNFDAETQPDWFGLPDDAELPSVFSIDYVRSWRYVNADWKDEGHWVNKGVKK